MNDQVKSAEKVSAARVKDDRVTDAKRLEIHLIDARTIDVRANGGPGINLNSSLLSVKAH